MSADFLKKFQDLIKPALDSSMDCVCIVDSSNQILHYNLPMKSFLGLRNRELGKKPTFCELVTLSVCDQSCQVQHVMDSGSVLKIDESPASKGKEKLRVSLRAIPLFDPDSPKDKKPIGALITLRDTTGEILLQAKYHKLLEMMMEKDSKIADLEDRLKALRSALRRARVDAVG